MKRIFFSWWSMMEFELSFSVFGSPRLVAIAKAVKRFLDFLANWQLRISNSLVTFGHPPHGSCAATEAHTRLHAEHPDIEERARPQNFVVHKPFA